ncbi:UNVERIFIED_CONTAM: serine/threonine-protein kinase PknG [Streptomyces graminofaciens]
MSGNDNCQRPGCPGSYEDMGDGELYCDTCGLAPVVSPTGMVSSPATGIAGGGGGGRGSSSARGSSRSSRASSRSSSSRRSVSGRLSRSLTGQSSARSVSVRSSGASAASSARNRLGAGLVSVPDVPRPDPRAAVMANPEVPERKRFCSRSDCGAPVGRARGDRPGRTEGFCTKCGHPYSFVPKLTGGDIVHGQYEVVGCLAHGGLGWVYLAVDRAVSDRWVVLKGLLDTGDQDAMAAAISERRFLAEIEHSNIVRIYNFVEHLDQRTGSLDGYIVMEYVGGKSLKELANERRGPDGRRDPLPVEQACAYGIEALEALGHLHSRNLLYCDFKVDNAIQQQDQLKLIDMGAVRRMDDDESAIYGTVGYQAPEVAEVGPSVASDLYTVARTLAVLTFDFQGYTNVFVDCLPDPENIEVFRTYESFYRLLVRATDPDPGRRFASAQEMAEQLTGVLREVVALQTGRPRPAVSTLFGPELRVTDTELFAEQTEDVSRLGARDAKRGRRAAAGAAQAPAPLPTAAGPGGYAAAPYAAVPGPRAPGGVLPGTAPAGQAPPVGTDTAPHLAVLDTGAASLALPVPRVDPNDPNAGFLAGLMTSAPAELIAALHTAAAGSPETRLRELRARLEMGDLTAATTALATMEQQQPDDWRVVWYRGVTSLVTGDHQAAALSFDAVYDAFPRRARAQAGPRPVRRGPRPVGQRGGVLPPRLDDRPEPCERGVRPGQGPTRRGRPHRSRTDAGVGAGGIDPLHRRTGGRRTGETPAARRARAAAGRPVGGCLAGRRPRGLRSGRRAARAVVHRGTRHGAGLGTLRKSRKRAVRSARTERTARQHAGRTRSALRAGTLLPGARPARPARRGADRAGGAGEPLPPPDVGVIDGAEAPAGCRIDLPRLRRTSGAG